MTESKPNRPARNRLIGLISTLAVLGFLAGGVAIAYDQITSFLSKFQIADYDGEPGPSVQITIEEGDDGAVVARKMVDADVVLSFDAIYREMLNADFTIYPGTYEFPTKLSGAHALRLLIGGENRVTISVAIPEGFRIQQIIERLTETFGFKAEEIEQALSSQLDRVSSDAPSLEGYLFPATYSFDPGVTAEQVVRKMVDRMEAELAQYDLALADSHDLLSLAALVQAEARNKEDFYKVSRVFANRLELGMPLQSDPSVKYRYEGEQSNFTDGVKDASNPFNTYIYKGIPVGPVGNPGSLAIEATLRPADGEWLYFVSINLATGETVFSETLVEHERAAELYRQWLRDNPGWND